MTTSSEVIAARVAELGPWFHNMGLGGVWTAPDHFLTVGTPLWVLVHPGDPARSVPYLAG